MRGASRAVLFLGVALALSSVPARANDGGDAPDAGHSGGAGPRLPDCIHVRTEAPWAMCYNHVVRVHSDCRTRATCRVSTDVNPTPATVTVEPGGDAEVLTFRCSPASVFRPIVRCDLAR